MIAEQEQLSIITPASRFFVKDVLLKLTDDTSVRFPRSIIMNLACRKVVVVYRPICIPFSVSQSRGVIMPGHVVTEKSFVRSRMATFLSWTALSSAVNTGNVSFLWSGRLHPIHFPPQDVETSVQELQLSKSAIKTRVRCQIDLGVQSGGDLTALMGYMYLQPQFTQPDLRIDLCCTYPLYVPTTTMLHMHFNYNGKRRYM